MRLVIDLQGAQATHGTRGIGRYSLGLAAAMAGEAGKHDVWIALNGAFAETIEPLRAALGHVLPQERIVVWDTPGSLAGIDPGNAWRQRAGEILREAFLASLKPDIVHVTSFFEGFYDDAVTSVGISDAGAATAITLYDLIPLINSNIYLTDPGFDQWYHRKLASLRRAGLWLAISESSRQDAINCLDLPPDRVVNIAGAADPRFRPLRVSDEDKDTLRRRYRILRPFVLYTGGIDHRKNIEGLVGAFARLPSDVRDAHQLVIVCSADKNAVKRISRYARSRGLKEGDVVLSGFVPDEDLVTLYNLCEGFCFPSTDEGLGLPVLEAMSCGAPIIGSNRSSIPEIIGRTDALFDPFDEADTAGRLHRLLTDKDYRRTLAEHGLQQARKFTWSATAKRSWNALEAQHKAIATDRRSRSFPVRSNKPRLAFVSPLPPERSGIADYSAELLPELSRHYDVEVVVDQKTVADAWINANVPVRGATWFDEHAHSYDRILYHIGNSVFHGHMFDLLERHPGVVVLHDFYLSGVIAHLDRAGVLTGALGQALYRSHGYRAVHESQQAKETSEIIWRYPANLAILQDSVGIIVHSEFARELARRFYGETFPDEWAVIPLLRRSPDAVDRKAARRALGLDEGEFVVCSFGRLGETKLNHRLLQTWLQSGLAAMGAIRLIFVGEDDGGFYCENIRRVIQSSQSKARVRVSGHVSPESYRQFLFAADMAVQLRTQSRGETSAAILDCLTYGVPTVVNTHGAAAELPRDAVFALPDLFTDDELSAAIRQLHADSSLRARLGARARSYAMEQLSPKRVGDRYQSAIERFYAESPVALRGRTVARLVEGDPGDRPEEEWLAVARALHHNAPKRRVRRQLLIDVSELAQRDVGSGIQRVARSALLELLRNPPENVQVEPVYATAEKRGYRYARRFARRLLGSTIELGPDDPIEFGQGDIFLGLDLQQRVVQRQSDVYAEMRRRGVLLYFVVYDLLPISLPHTFPPGAAELHEKWARVVSRYADGIVGISRSVADEVAAWLTRSGIERVRPPRIEWFHLGAELDRIDRRGDLPEGALAILQRLARAPTFLMVGTVEPRKAHAQVLAAFEQLWKRGRDVNLVIVGSQGWMVEGLVETLRSHGENGIRLFWLDGIGDEYLERIYAASSCLIAASVGEGFGLPLVEAARHKLPIIARDIPSFREVAGEHATYFRGENAGDLARCIERWLELSAAGSHPTTDRMPWLTWAQSVARLKEVVLRAQ